MSTFEVKIVKAEILPHPQADRLELCRIGGEGGYICVTGKDQFASGDLCIFVPPDSVIPNSMVSKLAANSKIKLENRIRPVKIRGIFSEGLCLKPSDWLPKEYPVYEDKDVTTQLGITKWEPPAAEFHLTKQGMPGIPHFQNPYFKSYDDVEHLKKNPDVLVEGEEVVVEVKTHGANMRAGYVKIANLSWFQRIMRMILRKNDMEFLVGSHNVVKSRGKKKTGYYKVDIWWRIAKEHDLEEKAQAMSRYLGGKSVTIYGEIYGPGIQSGYDYGVPEGELALKVFDIKVDGQAVDYDMLEALCTLYDLPMWAPCYRGPFSHEKIRSLTHNIIDEYGGKKYNREGTVTRPVKDRKDPRCGRVILKLINEAYLLDKTNSDFH